VIRIRAAEVRTRTGRLQRLFRPLVGPRGVQVFRRPSRGGDVVYGLGREGADPREVRHPSRCRTITLNYFEIWESHGGGREFSLERFYLHLYSPTADGREEAEVLALHCDPMSDPGERSYRYKRGPHMHLAIKFYDLHKAHIALWLSNLEEVCNTYLHFANAMEASINMINEEILERILNSQR
jgi:hypothetical protein